MRLWFLYDHDEVRLSRILTAHDAEAPPPADAADAAPARPRQMTVRTRQRAVRWHFCTLAAAFATSAIVAGAPRRGGPAQRRRAVGGVGLTKRDLST